jgi:transposase-like protein
MSDRFDHKLESKPAEGDAGPEIVRRIELITGTGRRRCWSSDDKVRMVVESLEPGATVSEVARRHGLSPQQLFAWRREARAMSGESTEVRRPPRLPWLARLRARCPPHRGPSSLRGHLHKSCLRPLHRHRHRRR